MKRPRVPKGGFAAPPIPWPACDHDEDDPKLAEVKVASGFYKKVKPDKTEGGEA